MSIICYSIKPHSETEIYKFFVKMEFSFRKPHGFFAFSGCSPQKQGHIFHKFAAPKKIFMYILKKLAKFAIFGLIL